MVTQDYSNMLERIKEVSEFSELYKNILENIDNQFKKYREYLDPNYQQQLKQTDTRSRIWEIRLVDYLIMNPKIELHKYSPEQLRDNKELTVPDFFSSIKIYYFMLKQLLFLRENSVNL